MSITIDGNTITMSNWSISSNLTETSSTLDKYEEGTWTPYWANDTGSAMFSGVGANKTFGASRYQRIGNMVYLYSYFGNDGTISYTTGNSSTTRLAIGGFPFTADTWGQLFCAFYANFASWDNASPTYGYTPSAYVQSNSSYALLVYPNYLASAYTTGANVQGTQSRMMISGFYKIL